MIRKRAIFIALGILILASALPVPAFAGISSITSTATITDGFGGFGELDGAIDISTVVIDSRTYALVASFADDGVQIIDITDPTDPIAIATINDGDGGFTELDLARDITTVVIDGSTYALVAALIDDGVQIINITTPSSPTVVATIDDVVMDPEPGVADVEKVLYVPKWIKNSAGMWSEDKINDDTFIQGIEFLVQEQIIDITLEANVSEVKDKNIIIFEEEKITQIPDWVKDNAGWWAEGLLSDEEFVNAIKFLIEKETIMI